MNNVDNSFLANPEIQQSMMKLMGIANQTKKKQISKEEIKQIKEKYVKMFFALGAINWCNGGTLGQAWQKALDTMGEYIKSKTKVLNHPMNPYLVAIHAKYRRAISEMILTNPHSNEELRVKDPKFRNWWRAYATERIKESKQFFDKLHQDYMPEQNITRLNSAEPFKQAQDQVLSKMQKIIALQQMRQRAA